METFLAALTLVCLAPATAAGQSDSSSGPTVTFAKEFPNSHPEYYSVSVAESGKALYRAAPDDDSSPEFALSPEMTDRIFSLVRKLDLFREAKLESKQRVAYMGTKTLAYQDGSERYQVSFNHTTVSEAIELTQIFERISQTHQHRLRLSYLVGHDRLGVMKELLSLETSFDQGRLLEPRLLLPLLEKIQNDRSLVQVARARAAQILAKIQAGK